MKPTIFMMLGLPGSGKTTYAQKLSKELGVMCYSLDEEYAKLGGDLQSHKWDETIAQKANKVIKDKTAKNVNSGNSVVFDFCPWKKVERDEYRVWIQSVGADAQIFYFDVEYQILQKRLATRNVYTKSAQYVNDVMLEDFVERFDAPTDEKIYTVLE